MEKTRKPRQIVFESRPSFVVNEKLPEISKSSKTSRYDALTHAVASLKHKQSISVRIPEGRTYANAYLTVRSLIMRNIEPLHPNLAYKLRQSADAKDLVVICFHLTDEQVIAREKKRAERKNAVVKKPQVIEEDFVDEDEEEEEEAEEDDDIDFD